MSTITKHPTIHGMALRSAILTNESIDHAQALLDRYIHSYVPATDLELELVEDLAVLRWRILRALAIETSLFDLATPSARETLAAEFDQADEMLATGAAFRQLAAENALPLLNRYEARLRSQFNRTRKNLLDLQASRPPQMGTPLMETTPQPMESLTDKSSETPIGPTAQNTTPPVRGANQFPTSGADKRIMVEKPNPVRPPRGGRGNTPEHVCPTVRERVYQPSDECEATLLKALDAFPGAKLAVARVLDRFMRPEQQPCAS